MLCNPDLNLYPYTRGGEGQPVISVDAAITRECINWEALQEVLRPREATGKHVFMLDTGPFSHRPKTNDPNSIGK